MELTAFIDELVKNVFTSTPREAVKGGTEYMELDEWSSLTAFSLISFIERTYGKKLLLPELLQAQTLEELYSIINGYHV